MVRRCPVTDDGSSGRAAVGGGRAGGRALVLAMPGRKDVVNVEVDDDAAAGCELGK